MENHARLRSFAATKNRIAMTPRRGRSYTFTYPSFFSRFGLRVSAVTTVAFLHLPAFFSACSIPPDTTHPDTKAQIYILRTEKTNLWNLDLFFFEDDSLARLDSYQHLAEANPRQVDGISCNGPKRIVALSGFPDDIYAWSDIRTYGSLARRAFCLEKENPGNPLLYGEGRVAAGITRAVTIVLQPVLAEVRIRSLACDFSDRPYAGAALEHPRLYLTNVSRECHPLTAGEVPFSWLNTGRLDEAATAALPVPEMVLQELETGIGATRLHPDIRLYAYPNPVVEEMFGHPFTRLVIEGSIGGTTYYYPINLARLEGNTSLALDITLTRTGSLDPDIPVSSGTVLLETDTVPWEQRPAATVTF